MENPKTRVEPSRNLWERAIGSFIVKYLLIKVLQRLFVVLSLHFHRNLLVVLVTIGGFSFQLPLFLTFLRCVAAIKFKMSQNNKTSHFKRLPFSTFDPQGALKSGSNAPQDHILEQPGLRI